MAGLSVLWHLFSLFLVLQSTKGEDTTPSTADLCSALRPLRNGYHTYVTIVEWTMYTATTTCNPGYSYVGVKFKFCSNGIWSDDRPGKCVKDKKYMTECGDPPKVEHATVSVKKLRTGGYKAVYSCDWGYELRTRYINYPPALHCMDGSRVWTGFPPSCTRIMRMSSNLTVTCYPALEQNPNLMTEPVNVLKTMSIVTECGDPPEVEHATVSVKELRYGGHKAVYSCNPGYKTRIRYLNSAPTLYCIEGGWAGSPPSCKRLIHCPTPPDVKNGCVEYPGLFVGAVARYYCNEGYKIIGDDSIVCLNNGLWSDEKICRPVNGK